MIAALPGIAEEKTGEYVTVRVGDHAFGLPIAPVQEVFVPARLTRVPLAPPEISGVLNLRGRIVTMIDMRRRLGMPEGSTHEDAIAVGIDFEGESYGLLVDEVGEVVKLSDAAREPNPVNLDRNLARFSRGIQRREKQLLVLLDIDRVLEFHGEAAAHVNGHCPARISGASGPNGED